MTAHGTTSAYNNDHCRCAPCTQANREWHASTRHRRFAQRSEVDGRLVHPGRNLRHGKPATYANWGCRCDACTAAATDQRVAYRRRRQAARTPD